MPTPGMVTDMVISRQIDAAVKEEFSDEKGREDAWKFYKFAHIQNVSLFRFFSFILGLIFIVLLFVSAIMTVNQGTKEAAPMLAFGLIVLCIAIGLWKLSSYFLKRSVVKLKALIDSDPVYWGRIQSIWQRIWIDAGSNIGNGFGGTCPQQTSIIERSDGITLLVR